VGALIGTGYFLIKTQKNLDVKWTQEDYNSCVTKSKVNIVNYEKLNLENLINGEFESSGSINVEDTFSNEEISAILSLTNRDFGPIKDIKVKFLGDNKAEATFIITEKVIDYAVNNEDIKIIERFKDKINNVPMYLKVKIDKTSSKTVSIDIQKLSLGRIGVPADIKEKAQSNLEPLVNDIIAKYEGFSMEKLQFNEEGLYFKGTLPEEVSGK